MNNFRFLRAMIKQGGFSFPSFVTVDNKNYMFCGSYSLGDLKVYKYEFDNMPVIEFTLHKSDFNRIRRLGDEYQKRLGKLHPIHFI